MNISGMNVRILFQQNRTIIDDIGNHKSIWEDYYACWATASNQTGDEQEDAGQTMEEDKMDFTVRYSSETAAVTTKGYRIILNDRIYNIDHIDDMGFHHNSLKFHATLVRR